MKTKTAFFALSILLASNLAFASTPGHKFIRGLEGIVTSPVEYINQYQLAHSKQGLVPSVGIGVIGGTAVMIKRLINGVYDVVSFPIKNPRDYGLLLDDPSETAIQAYKANQNTESAIL